MNGFINPVTYDIKSATKLEQCSKTIVNCLDNWSQWNDTDELLIGTCTLSSSEDVTVYEFKPVETTAVTYYFLGSESYIANFCWPGPTPLYSPFEKYPDNPLYAIVTAYSELTTAFTAAWLGLNYNAKAMEGPVERSSWDDLYKHMSNSISRDLHNYLKF